MELTGSYQVPAPRDRVWAALNDPEILQLCIPGCQSVEKLSDSEFAITTALKVGPVKARFRGSLFLTDVKPAESCMIVGEGNGGVAGFAKGGAAVSLTEQDGVTELAYAVRAQIGGKLAQVGNRLLDATARKMAREFFDEFVEVVCDGAGDLESLNSEEPIEPIELAPEPETEPTYTEEPPPAWSPAASVVAPKPEPPKPEPMPEPVEVMLAPVPTFEAPPPPLPSWTPSSWPPPSGPPMMAAPPPPPPPPSPPSSPPSQTQNRPAAPRWEERGPPPQAPRPLRPLRPGVGNMPRPAPQPRPLVPVGGPQGQRGGQRGGQQSGHTSGRGPVSVDQTPKESGSVFVIGVTLGAVAAACLHIFVF
ncbi:conserved hypothetical protein [uncultured Gammaproteobacteria bacterium]